LANKTAHVAAARTFIGAQQWRHDLSSCGVQQAGERNMRDGAVGHPTDREKPVRLIGF
jgi:hypothetical protein